MYIHLQTMSCISSLRAQGYDSQSDSVSYVSLYMHERLYARGCISSCLVWCSFSCTATHTPYPLDTYAVWLRTLHRAPSGTCVSVLSSGFLRDPCECVLPRLCGHFGSHGIGGLFACCLPETFTHMGWPSFSAEGLTFWHIDVGTELGRRFVMHLFPFHCRNRAVHWAAKQERQQDRPVGTAWVARLRRVRCNGRRY